MEGGVAEALELEGVLAPGPEALDGVVGAAVGAIEDELDPQLSC